MKLRALADLHTLRTVLREHERMAAERAAQERAALAAAERGRRQFADAVGPVTRMRCHGRMSHALPGPSPEPLQRPCCCLGRLWARITR